MAKKSHGKQMINYETIQYVSNLERFVGYIRQDNEMGNLIRIQIDQYQQIMGTERHFLTLDSSYYPYEESSWIQNTRNGVKLMIKGAWKEKITLMHDIFIMEKICQDNRPTYILERLNDVMLFLKVLRLSDIVHPNGSDIEHWALYSPPADTSVIWPKRRQPLEENMKLWRDTIKTYFCGMNEEHPIV